MSKQVTALTSSKDFESIGDASLAKELADLLLGLPDELTPEEYTRANRLKGHLIDLGRAHAGSNYLRSLKAEIIYDIQQEGDWTLLNNPESGKNYFAWNEFREVLAKILFTSTGSIGNYIKLVRVAREVLGVPDGRFAEVGGITTVGHIVDIASGLDGRSTDDYTHTIRPKTEEAKDNLSSYGTTYAEQFKGYFWQEVAHDLNAQDAINKPAQELSAQAKEITGAPDVRAFPLLGDGEELVGYKLTLKYPDQEVDGTTVVGSEETFELRYTEWVPAPVRDWVSHKLRAD